MERLDHRGVSKLNQLVSSWLDKGVNLTLAGPLVATFNDVYVSQVLPPENGNEELAPQQRARRLLQNTDREVKICQATAPAEFIAQSVGNNVRWETLGLFLAAATRAVLDTPCFMPLYSTEEQRRSLTRVLTYMNDCCLEICLALDSCVADTPVRKLHHPHSSGRGSQEAAPAKVHKPNLKQALTGYHVWRTMGDLVSSLCAIGYHQKIEGIGSDIPPFIAELRRACFARIYATDNNVSILLGRPARRVSEFCYFQIPTDVAGGWNQLGDAATAAVAGSHEERHCSTSDQGSNQEESINHTADIQCGALFARYKEEILRKLFQNPSDRVENVST